MAALTLAFDATIIQTQGPGHSSTEVVLNLGSQGQPIQVRDVILLIFTHTWLFTCTPRSSPDAAHYFAIAVGDT